MPFITKTEFESLFGTFALAEAMRKSSVREVARTRVFLSHSSHDNDSVKRAIAIMTNEGSSVYVDIEDVATSSLTINEIGAYLRGQIIKCNRMVVLASEAVQLSKWVPWELGIADGKLTASNVALLPVKSYSGDWRGTEFVGLYKTIQRDSDGKWIVCDPGFQYIGTDLSSWLN